MSLILPKHLYGVTAGSCKVEKFGFAVFHDEASVNKDF